MGLPTHGAVRERQTATTIVLEGEGLGPDEIGVLRVMIAQSGATLDLPQVADLASLVPSAARVALGKLLDSGAVLEIPAGRYRVV